MTSATCSRSARCSRTSPKWSASTSGRDALRHLLEGDFAVILLDVFMPGMDGYETASIIREREQTARIPIIFLSAVNKETEHLMRGYAMGAVDYVFKPVEPVVLKSKVSVFVDLFAMRQQVEAKSRAEQELRDANYRAELERLRIERELRANAGPQQAAILDALPIALFEGLVDPDGQPQAPLRRRRSVAIDRGQVGRRSRRAQRLVRTISIPRIASVRSRIDADLAHRHARLSLDQRRRRGAPLLRPVRPRRRGGRRPSSAGPAR